MSNLQEKVGQDWKDAMKARDPKKDVLSLIKTELKNKAINERNDGAGSTAVNDEDAISVLQKMAKQRKEAIESFIAGKRLDLADKERFELSVIESYLPKPLDDAELLHMIDVVLKETGAAGLKDLGKVMGIMTKQSKGRADGRKVQELVRQRLQ